MCIPVGDETRLLVLPSIYGYYGRGRKPLSFSCIYYNERLSEWSMADGMCEMIRGTLVEGWPYFPVMDVLKRYRERVGQYPPKGMQAEAATLHDVQMAWKHDRKVLHMPSGKICRINRIWRIHTSEHHETFMCGVSFQDRTRLECHYSDLSTTDYRIED